MERLTPDTRGTVFEGANRAELALNYREIFEQDPQALSPACARLGITEIGGRPISEILKRLEKDPKLTNAEGAEISSLLIARIVDREIEEMTDAD